MMNESTIIDTPEFFRQLDDEFIDIKTVKDDTFVYKGKDVRVNSTWELPIIIQWPGSSIDFEFTTASGGIEFGIVFVPATDDEQNQDELQVETIEEMTRVRSDLERISGSFTPPSEGVVFFIWDNIYDWSAVKHLSYSVDVFQPSFTLPDIDRSEASLQLLSDVVDDIETSTLRLEHGEDEIEYYTPNVEALSSQYEHLRIELANKIASLSMLDAEEDALVSFINSNHDSIAGIGIRCLNKHLLSVVLSYLYHPQYEVMDGGAGIVCSYWRQIVQDIRLNGIITGPVEVFHVRPEKLRFVKRSESNVEPLDSMIAYFQDAERHRWALLGTKNSYLNTIYIILLSYSIAPCNILTTSYVTCPLLQRHLFHHFHPHFHPLFYSPFFFTPCFSTPLFSPLFFLTIIGSFPCPRCHGHDRYR